VGVVGSARHVRDQVVLRIGARRGLRWDHGHYGQHQGQDEQHQVQTLMEGCHIASFSSVRMGMECVRDSPSRLLAAGTPCCMGRGWYSTVRMECTTSTRGLYTKRTAGPFGCREGNFFAGVEGRTLPRASIRREKERA